MRRTLGRILPAMLAAVLLWGSAEAGTLEFSFAKPDRDKWEYEGVVDADFTPEGLRFHFGEGDNRKPKQIILKEYFVDDTDVQAWVDRSAATPSTQTVLVLDNPELKRRVEMLFRIQSGRRGKPYSYGALSYRKDGVVVGRRSGWDNESGPGERVRLRKVNRRVHGAVQSKTPGGLLRWATSHYPRVDFDEDCDRFRVAVMVVPPAKGPATTIVLKSVHIKGPQVGSPDVDRNEPKVTRFDFGPVQQQVAEGYVAVNPHTMYTSKRGYGWKTDLTPMRTNRFKKLTNAESIKLGLGASYAEEGWKKSCDLTLNWTRKVKLRPLLATAHGWDRISALGKTYDLKTPQEKDLVYACRHYGFPHDYRIEADQWERRGAIYVDDDLYTEFVVDVPNGRYNAILGIGYQIGGPYHHAPLLFSVEAEGITVQKKMSQNWERCNRFLVNDVEVKDGQLTLGFRADRRLSMNVVTPYDLACGWMINFLVLVPAEDPGLMEQEEWRLIMERSKRVRQLTFEPGKPAHVNLKEGYIQLNGKPFMPIVLQYGYGWPRTTYHLYTWANTYTEGLASSEIGGSAAFFRKDWKKMSYWDNYPWRAIAAMNSAIRHGNLDFLYCENFVYIVPRAIAGEGGRLEDARGRQNRWSVKPPLASRLAMEIIKESYTMISTQLKLHPANCGYYIYEEFVHPRGYGYDFQSVTKFREYLREQYHSDIKTLNAEWGTNYADFHDVEPPKKDGDEGPAWRNFWKFRRWSMYLQAMKAAEMAKSLEPEHTTMGQKCKPHPMSTTWHTAEAVELFGGGGPPSVHLAGAKHFKRGLTYCGGYWDCPWSWVDGRRQLDHKPKAKRYQGRHLLPVYNDTISRLFQGVKGFWTEEYNDGVRHMFHRTSLIKRDSPKGKIKTWFGDIVFFDKEAHEFAPVTPCLPPLRWSRAVQFAYRLGPLLLPAQPVRGDVAVMMTEDAFLVRTGSAGTHRFLNSTDKLLRQLNITYDLIRDENLDELQHYPVVLLAGYTEVVAPEIVDALKAHVKLGGKVILMDTALNFDARRQKQIPRGPFNFRDVAGVTYRWERWPRPQIKEPVKIVGGDFLKTVKVGDTIAASPYFPLYIKLRPAEGSTVVATMGKFNVGVMNKEKSVFTLSIPHLRVDWHGTPKTDPTLRDLIGDVMAGWGVKRGIAHKTGPVGDVELRAMKGEDYWLAAVLNRVDEKRTAKVVLNFLSDGVYDIVDVTGERPLIEKDKRGVLTRLVDAEFRKGRWIAKATPASALKTAGLSLDVDGIMARVLLIRPAGEKTWVNAPGTTLRHLADRAGVVVVGDKATPAELAAAQKLIDAAKTLRNTTLVLRKAAQMKIETKREEVWVDEYGRGNPKSRQRQRYGGGHPYLVDVFANKPVLTDSNLILVGSARTNELVKHFETPNTFTYDKVLMKVEAQVPGPGRGAIGLVESINRAALDTSSFSHDAIVIGGSDDAGTTAAVDRFIELLKVKDVERDVAVAAPPAPPAPSFINANPVAAEGK